MNFTELKKLNLPIWKYAIFGSWPLWVRNIRESQDLDLLVTQDLWNELVLKYEKYLLLEPYEHIQIWEIEIMQACVHLDFEKINEMIKNADIIENLPFVKLEDIRDWKTNMWREKDFKDVDLINNYLENL